MKCASGLVFSVVLFVIAFGGEAVAQGAFDNQIEDELFAGLDKELQPDASEETLPSSPAKPASMEPAAELQDSEVANKELDDDVVALRKKLAAVRAERDAARAELDAVKQEWGVGPEGLDARLSEIKQLMDKNRKDRVTLSYNLGCLYKASKQYEKAEAQFLEALAYAPDDPAIHYNLGVLYDDCLKRTDKAREHYARFLELAPNDADAPRVIEWLSVIR
jgi:tetratricopeptide (TPR) repeat protein